MLRWGRARRWIPDVVVFALILLLGLMRLPTPFTGDQALNMLMGEVVAGGGRPYVDLWDLKHPGVFLFFATGGALFGFTEVGIRLFELAWMLALAVVVRVTAGAHLDNRWAATAASALTVGAYYAGSTSLHLTQTEALVGLPLLLSLTCAAIPVLSTSRRPLGWFFAAGLSAGVVAVFKAPYVVLPGVFWLLALVEWRRRRHDWAAPPGLWPIAAVLAAGLGVPVLAVLVYLAMRPGLDVVWWTFVVHPREAAAQTVLDPQRLIDSSVWFVRTFPALLVLALIGGWDRLKRGWDLVPAALVAWVAVGAALIWVQVLSWWEYHYLLLLVPVGLLAAQGVETVWTRVAAVEVRSRRRVILAGVVAVLVVLAVPQLRPVTRSAVGILGSPPGAEFSLRAHQAEQSSEYAAVLATTSFLREPDSHPGPIYVVASPTFYVLAQRPPAIPYLAPWFHPTDVLWNRLTAALENAAPAYVYLAEGALETMVGYNPGLRAEVDALRPTLERRYEELRTDEVGTWYVRADLEPGDDP